MEETLVDKIKLKNDLTLELYDKSRRVAGDRWLVLFVARMAVEVKAKYVNDNPEVSLEAVQGVLGEKVHYALEKKSYFVDESKKDAVFEKLKKEFLDISLGYLSGADFPFKLILRRYRESRKISRLSG
ncbi:MAG: hypothetical protein JRF28_08790 [Deltaproteobacteria bacterium]|nr:hypothetical protein [Deltaproteobacteria bacterium]